MALEFQFDGTAPTLSEVIRAESRNQGRSNFSALPARITSYDKDRTCADAQPVVKAGGGDSPVRDLPPLVCMPVLFPSGGGMSITWDLAPGDGCLVVFGSVSASQWLTSGEEGANPESPRRQSLSDGFIIPGLRAFTNPLASAATAGLTIGLDDGSAQILITPSGDITIKAGSVGIGDNPVDFVALAALVSANLTAIAAAFTSLVSVNGLLPPIPPYAPTPVAAVDTKAS